MWCRRWAWLFLVALSAVLCMVLWVKAPQLSVVEVENEQSSGLGNADAAERWEGGALATPETRLLGASSALSDSRLKTILFPAPTLGFGADVPFTFDPTQALSAPPSAFSFVERVNGSRSLAKQTVALYAVDHGCTQTHPHVDKQSVGGIWSRRTTPPFVQSLQATGPHLLLESSGGFNQSYVREFDAKTGKAERMFRLRPQDFAEGVAALYVPDLQRLLLLLSTWHSGVVYVLDYETFQCVGYLDLGVEAWGFVSSLDLRLWRARRDAREKVKPAADATGTAATADAAGAPALDTNELEQKFAADVAKQRLWLTTGGPELLEVSVPPLLAALTTHLRRRPWPAPPPRGRSGVVETLPTPRCGERIGRVELSRVGVVHCLGQVLVGLNEMEYWPQKHALLANLYGLPLVAMMNADNGECMGIISLSGVHAVDRFHESDHRVTNGLAFPLSQFDENAPWLYVTGKEWPVVVSVRLRRLLESEDVGTELSQVPKTCRGTQGPSGRFLQVKNMIELRRKVPGFFPPR